MARDTGLVNAGRLDDIVHLPLAVTERIEDAPASRIR
jgi:hypothetical protein